MSLREVKLPEMGENIASGTVASIPVAPGTVIKEGDALIEIETDKAVLSVPAPVTGRCVEIRVASGQEIKVGQVIAVFDTDGEAGLQAAEPERAAEPARAAEPDQALEPEKTHAAPLAPAKAAAESKKLRRMLEVPLPDLGDGVSSGTVASILAQIGADIAAGDGLIEIETDKAVVSVPTVVAGKVIDIRVKTGDIVKPGQTIAILETAGGDGAVAAEPSSPVTHAAAPVRAAAATAAPTREAQDLNVESPESLVDETLPKSGAVVAAGPATRKFARELGVDLTQVKGLGRAGRITIEDIKAHVKQSQTALSASASVAVSPSAAAQLPDFSKFGNVRREPLAHLRKIIAERMAQSWARIPHVFQFQEIDITPIVRMHQSYGEEFKKQGSSASPTNFIIKALGLCLKEYPQFNASLDEGRKELIYKEYYNIGVAVDTPAGLIVPVLKGVDRLTLFEIGRNLAELAKRTRERKIAPEDLAGGSMTLSNLGGIGGTHFTPIVNWPEVAILGVGRTEVRPLYREGKFVPRSVVQVCLSYDHRVIDGADGARFVSRLKDILENMERTLLGA